MGFALSECLPGDHPEPPVGLRCSGACSQERCSLLTCFCSVCTLRDPGRDTAELSSSGQPLSLLCSSWRCCLLNRLGQNVLPVLETQLPEISASCGGVFCTVLRLSKAYLLPLWGLRLCNVLRQVPKFLWYPNSFFPSWCLGIPVEQEGLEHLLPNQKSLSVGRAVLDFSRMLQK